MTSLEEEGSCVCGRPSECNVIVLSESGKPIFARYGSDEEVARVCGLLEAVRTSIRYSRTLGLGEIQSLRSGSLCLVFMTVQAITLVALAAVDEESSIGASLETEAYLRLQLEYVFAQILLTTTEQVQTMFQQNASFDLQSMLGVATMSRMRALLDDAGPTGHPGPLLLGATQPVLPISPEVRERASEILLTTQAENTVFALLLCDGKLLSLVQPPFRPHQLRVSDLHLLLHFLSRHQGLLSSELWLPVCLPRFNSSGFLYCYTHCLHEETKLVLALVSPLGTTEQFQAFRETATRIRHDLGLSAVVGSVLTILDTETSFVSAHGTTTDVKWKYSQQDAQVVDGDEDYVDASGDGDKMIPYVGGIPDGRVTSLLQELRASMDPASIEFTLEEYLDIGQALHFLFRLDVPIPGNDKARKGGHLSQCISSSLQCAPFDDPATRRRLWSMYQKLKLRLRLGSASMESTMDAFDMITQDHVANNEVVAPTIGRYCPAMGLVEAPPNRQGLSYIMDDSEIFLALNGSDFELYVTASSTIPVQQVAAAAGRLARHLVMDQQTLFLSSPLTWKR